MKIFLVHKLCNYIFFKAAGFFKAASRGFKAQWNGSIFGAKNGRLGCKEAAKLRNELYCGFGTGHFEIGVK